VGWALRRSRWGAVVIACGLCPTPPAGAASSSWLGWSAPAECQNTAEVERRLSSLLGHSVEADSLPPTLVRTGWSAERGWAVRVTVQLAMGSRDRSLDAPSCADALDVIALSLALILDPSLGAGSPGAAEPSATEVTVAPVETAPPLWGDELKAPVARSAAPDPATAAERSPSAGAAASAAPSRAARWVVGGGPLTDLGIFPVPQFGGGVQLGLVVDALRVELEADVLASESFRSYFAGLRGCYTLDLSSRFGWVSCAGGELGSLVTRELGGDQHRADGLWLAAEASTGPEFAATRWLRAFARARAAIPLIRHEFLLSEGSRVHELPWVSPQLQVGISMDLTDLDGGEH
jgi:hypothetical protein